MMKLFSKKKNDRNTDNKNALLSQNKFYFKWMKERNKTLEISIMCPKSTVRVIPYIDLLFEENQVLKIDIFP